MKNLTKFLTIALSLFAGLIFGMNIKIFYETSTFKPYGWDAPPTILNCYGSDFSRLQMSRAMDYWAIRGHTLEKYVHNPSEEQCKKEWIPGYIIVRKSNSLKVNTLGSTRRYTTLTTMRGAVIHYRPGSFNLDLINEHELGHALGFAHVEIEDHIMHPDFGKMGRDFWIPVE